jgi:hypothetical protein
MTNRRPFGDPLVAAIQLLAPKMTFISAPYTPENGELRFQVEGTGNSISVATFPDAGHMTLVPSQYAPGAYEVNDSSVGPEWQGLGLGLSFYMLAAEAAKQLGSTGITPNISRAVSTDAQNLWNYELPRYGDIESFTIHGGEAWEERGLNVIFSDPKPPASHSSWKRLVLDTGGTWLGEQGKEPQGTT